MTALGGPIDWTAKLLIAGTVGALVASRRKIWPIETLTWSWARAGSHMLYWAGTAASAVLDYCFGFGAVLGAVSYFVMFYEADAAWTAQRTAHLTGAIASAAVAVPLLAVVRPSTWIKPPTRPTLGPRVVAALASGAITLALTIWTSAVAGDTDVFANIIVNLVTSAGVTTIVGLSRLTDRQAVNLVRALLVGALSGVIVAAISTFVVAPVPIPMWMALWTSGGAVLALTAALVGALVQQIRPPLLSDRAAATDLSVRGWARTLLLAVVVAMVLGAAAMTVGRLVGQKVLRDAAVLLVNFDANFYLVLVFALIAAVAVALAGTLMAGLLGGLVGLLSGATGADIERRLVPNQGIRQSARNIVVFAALGTLIIGVPYGILNLSVGALAMWTPPSPADWWRLAIAPGVALGVLAGLLPGAAVIQHFVLRLVLWGSGVVPLRYVQFLNFATQRRLLQRVGGRYRFIHVLLRDHLVAAQ